MAEKMSKRASKAKHSIIKTIFDENEVENFSSESESDVEHQPTKKIKRVSEGMFDSNFEFVSSTAEYNKDVWNDLSKYVKRKAKTKTDDKIKKIMSESDNNVEEDEKIIANDDDNDVVLSDDELQHDTLKSKTAKGSAQKEKQDEFFEDLLEYDENSTFQQMNLSRPLLKAIQQLQYVHTTPIQAATIPVALSGRDICGCAATGTGKTAAYMLPILERLLFRTSDLATATRVLVLVPTRELGVQVYQVTKQLAQFTDIAVGLAVGGLDLKAQEQELRKRPDIIIATPGRLIDHLYGTVGFSLHTVEVLILDEADRILDEYFADQMKEIIKQCNVTRQTMLFSATMTDEVKDLAMVSLKNPMRIFVDSNREVAFNLRQEFVRLRNNKESDREAILCALVCRTFRDRCIIFVRTKKQAHRVHILLGLCGCTVAELHGNLTQPQRLDTLQRFKEGRAHVLVATDVAARGLDIPDVRTVVNFTMPATLEQYIHRVGRTARAGRAGVSVSIAGEPERKLVKQIIRRARNTVKSRVIPCEIIEKYQKRIEQLEEKIEQILQEELAERLLSKAENQLNRSKRMMETNATPEMSRGWFQGRRERKDKEKSLKEKREKQTEKKKKKMGGKKEVANGRGKARGKEGKAGGKEGKQQSGPMRKSGGKGGGNREKNVKAAPNQKPKRKSKFV